MASAGGRTWLAGNVVLKSVDDDVEAASLAELSVRLSQRGFRLARPLPARDGRWVVDGWTASTRVAGEHSTTRWSDLILAADAFHRATALLPEPAFIAQGGWALRSAGDRWRFADRVAWGDLPVGELVAVPYVAPLLAATRSIAVRDQIVHCDLVGNVLFAEGLAPAIIDLSLYWRPTGYATAIAVADAITWERAPLDTLSLLDGIEEASQLLIRALLFRVISGEFGRRMKGMPPGTPELYEPLIEIALAHLT
jgi:uncharacterized protein (TIGR02569 family)